MCAVANCRVNRYDSVICVASTTKQYELAETSNFGRLISIMAPGDKIRSANFRDPKKYILKSGTSMAAAHVTGIMAIYISYQGINDNALKVNTLLSLNARLGGTLGISDAYFPEVKDTLFANHGLANPVRCADQPYVGPPCGGAAARLETFEGNDVEPDPDWIDDDSGENEVDGPNLGLPQSADGADGGYGG